MLVSRTSAAALPLTCFRGLTRVPNSARVPGVAHPCSRPTNVHTVMQRYAFVPSTQYIHETQSYKIKTV